VVFALLVLTPAEWLTPRHVPLVGVAVSASNCPKFTLPDVDAMAERGLATVPTSAIVQGGGEFDGFTVLMLVHSRKWALRELVLHYVSMRQVRKMIVLWAVTTEDPPSEIDARNVSESGRKGLKKLTLQRTDSNSLTVRFKSQPNITTDAVFSVDDDQLVAEDDVNHAFDVWKAHPWGVVGFNKKIYSWSDKTSSFTYGGKNDATYHFILTNAAFIHRSYLDLFDRHLEPSIRQDIDRQMNCEDLAMNVLIGDYCRCTAAFYVKAHHRIKGPSSSSTGLAPIQSKHTLSSRPRHYITRSECLNSMARYYRARLAPNSCTY
jgi:hypothetical protein